MPFSKILLPMAPEEPDASMHALEVARELLREGGEIHTLTVLEVPPGYLKGYLTDAQITELAEKHREARRDTQKVWHPTRSSKGIRHRRFWRRPRRLAPIASSWRPTHRAHNPFCWARPRPGSCAAQTAR